MVLIRKLMLYTLIVFALSAIGTIMADEAFSDWFNPDWNYRKKITINSSQVPVTQTNFPVFVEITGNFLKTVPVGNVGKANGGDILFTDLDGITKRDHEIENYNGATGNLTAWVELPLVSASTDTEFYMYYGNSGAADQWNMNGTWNANYGIVYHMDPSGTDSTVNGRNRVADVGSPTADNSFMGLGLSFDGDDAWDQADLGGGGGYWEQQWSVRSHEIVFRTGNDVTARQTLFSEGGSVNGMILYIVNGNLYARWWSEAQGWGGGSQSSAVLANTTYHVILSYTFPGSYELFVNSASVGSTATSAIMNAHNGDGGIAYTGTTSKDFHDCFGCQGYFFTGSIYEFRIMDTAANSGYASTTYNNQSSPSSFISFDIQESFAPIPAVNEWGMIIFLILAGLLSVYSLHNQRREV